MRRVVVAALALTLGWSACALEARCPCGQSFDRDPLDPEATLSVPADHSPGDHCWCRCGEDGEPERMSPANDCRGFERECARPDGAPDVYVCE